MGAYYSDKNITEYLVHALHTNIFFVCFLIKQLVVNSKKIGGSAAGQTKRIEKNRSLLVFFEYSINHNNRTSV